MHVVVSNPPHGWHRHLVTDEQVVTQSQRLRRATIKN